MKRSRPNPFHIGESDYNFHFQLWMGYQKQYLDSEGLIMKPDVAAEWARTVKDIRRIKTQEKRREKLLELRRKIMYEQVILDVDYPTTRGLENIDAWLGDGKWDVIHFNWGLHDLKYMGPNNENLADPNDASSHQQVPSDEYESNLKTLVERMQETGATLIWRTTTPVPEGAKGRVVGDSKTYNDVAKRIMRKQKIAIDDQYTYSIRKISDLQRKADVHYTTEGSIKLAEQATIAIKKALKKAK